MADVPRAENIPTEGVRTGPRSEVWQVRDPATHMLAEVLDSGGLNLEVDPRDRMMSFPAPSHREPGELLKSEYSTAGHVAS